MKFIVGLLVCGLLTAASLLSISEQGQVVVADEEKVSSTAPEADDSDDKSALEEFMYTKLEASNQILEGLVTDKMKKVQAGADALLEMSDAAQWRASTDMLYLQHSRTFRQSVLSLREKAGKGSVDGVALAWMDVTLNCIRCHDWVRNVMVADLEPVPADLFAENRTQ